MYAAFCRLGPYIFSICHGVEVVIHTMSFHRAAGQAELYDPDCNIFLQLFRWDEICWLSGS